MKGHVIFILGILIGVVLGFFPWNDMRYQRDVALTTADWCQKSPNGWRCQAFLSGAEKVPHNYNYHD